MKDVPTKKIIVWTILFAPYGLYLLYKEKHYKVLGVMFVLGLIPVIFQEPQSIKKPYHKVSKVKVVKMSLDLIHNDAKMLLKHGKSMSSLRSSSDLNKVASCGKLMRKHQAHVKSLRLSNSQHDQIPKKVYLGSALISLNLCVSCSKTLADKSCDQAHESLMQLKKL